MKNTAAKRPTATPASDTPAPTPSLEQLTARWAQAKNTEETGRREAEKLRAEIVVALAAAGRPVIGYTDDHLEIGSTSRLDPEEARLVRGLERLGALERAQETRISIEKVRALAKLEPEVAELVDRCATATPRFERAAKKH